MSSSPGTSLRPASRRHFFVYCIIGTSGATLDFAVYSALVNVFDWHHQLANLASISCGISNNFIWNSRFNFRVRNQLWRRFISFYSIGCFGLGLSALMLYVGIDQLHLNPTAAKFLTIFFIVLVQYNLNRVYSFGDRAN